MPPFGILFLLAGSLFIRQVAVGRARDIPDDMRDLATSLLSGDTTAVGEVMGRRGNNVVVTAAGIASDLPGVDGVGDVPPLANHAGSQGLVNEVVRLGDASGRYVLGATGPDAYDCSGLVWRACLNIGVFKGSRFTTSTFSRIAGSWAKPVAAGQVGDIVLWAGKHMGVVVAPDTMYSARSSHSNPNIGRSSISGDSGYFGTRPTYWRV